MKKILFISPQPFFEERGTPMNVREFVTQLGGAGYAVDLLTYPHGAEIKLPHVTIRRCLRIPFIKKVPVGFSTRKLLYDTQLLLYGAVLTAQTSYVAVHGVEEGGFIAGLLGLVFRVPFVVDMDSCLVEQARRAKPGRLPGALRLLRRLEQFFLRRARAVVTVCAALTEKARTLAPHTAVFQIEDFPLELPEHVSREVQRQIASELPAGGKVILYTGNLESYQGIELLLRAFKRFLVEMHGAEIDGAEVHGAGVHGAGHPVLAIVGGEEAHRKQYALLTEQLNIDSQVVFLGKRPPEMMGGYMARADLLVSPRASGENTPLKLYTYMASGRPLLVTNITSHTQAVSEESAFLAAPSEVGFAQGMAKALAAPDRFERAARAQQLAATQFSREAFQRKVVGCYQFIVEGHTSAPKPPPREDERSQQRTPALDHRQERVLEEV